MAWINAARFYQRQLPLPFDTFTLHGSYGELEVDATTGRVLAYRPEPTEPLEYQYIVKVDVAEHRAAHGDLGLYRYDILDFGFWYLNEDLQLAYEAPEAEWREDILGTPATVIEVAA